MYIYYREKQMIKSNNLQTSLCKFFFRTDIRRHSKKTKLSKNYKDVLYSHDRTRTEDTRHKKKTTHSIVLSLPIIYVLKISYI